MTKRGRAHLVAAAIACAACSGGTAPRPAAPLAPAGSMPDVQSIIAAMKARYRDAKTYSDEGTLRDVIRPGQNDEHVTNGRFQTRWAAPDRLAFTLEEDRSGHCPYTTLAIWTPRSHVTKALFLGEVEDGVSLERELAAKQGVSHGLSGIVPRWLSRGCQCSGTYKLHGTAACGASSCYQLEASLNENHHVTLFVSTTTSALMRYVMRAIVPGRLPEEALARLSPEDRERLAKGPQDPFEAVTTIDFSPTFDAPIDESAFAGPSSP